jgi:hypothetical protein
LRFLPAVARVLRRVADSLDQSTWEVALRNPKGSDAALDEYVVGIPKAQNAIDTLPGWNQALPPHVGVTAGCAAFYNDPRIHWALEQFGSIRDCKILELGPLEASHTYMLDMQVPELIHAIEANKLSFLRCLVVKELLELKRVKFFLGDFLLWLENTSMHYDFIIASGVLYHMQNPVHLLELIAKRADAFYLWTHYASDKAMPTGDPRRSAFVGPAEVEQHHGVATHLHRRSYHGAWRNKSFCGGMHDLHRWIEKDDIIALICALGFRDVRIEHDDPAHQNGPSFSVFARRSTLGKI